MRDVSLVRRGEGGCFVNGKDYEFNCDCCKARRIRRSNGRKRYVYQWNGLEFDDVVSWAEHMGMKHNTLRSRLDRGQCLHATTEELIPSRMRGMHRDPPSSHDSPCGALATRFLRVMARTMRVA